MHSSPTTVHGPTEHSDQQQRALYLKVSVGSDAYELARTEQQGNTQQSNRTLEDCFLAFLSCKGDYEKLVVSICGFLQRHSLAMKEELRKANLLKTVSRLETEERPPPVALVVSDDDSGAESTGAESTGAEATGAEAKAPTIENTIPTVVTALTSFSKEHFEHYENSINSFTEQAKIDAAAWVERFQQFVMQLGESPRFERHLALSQKFSLFCQIPADQRGEAPLRPQLQYWRSNVFEYSKGESASVNTVASYRQDYFTAREKVQAAFFNPEATNLREAICEFVFPFFRRLSTKQYYTKDKKKFTETQQQFKEFLKALAQYQGDEAFDPQPFIPTDLQQLAQFLAYCHSLMYLFEEIAVLQIQLHSNDGIVYPAGQPKAIQLYFEQYHQGDLKFNWHKVPKRKLASLSSAPPIEQVTSQLATEIPNPAPDNSDRGKDRTQAAGEFAALFYHQSGGDPNDLRTAALFAQHFYRGPGKPKTLEDPKNAGFFARTFFNRVEAQQRAPTSLSTSPSPPSSREPSPTSGFGPARGNAH